MNPMMVIVNPDGPEGLVGGHRFKCRSTVVSQSWSISLKWPWNRVKRRFLVWPTDCIPQGMQVITYIKLELWQFTLIKDNRAIFQIPSKSTSINSYKN